MSRNCGRVHRSSMATSLSAAPAFSAPGFSFRAPQHAQYKKPDTESTLPVVSFCLLALSTPQKPQESTTMVPSAKDEYKNVTLHSRQLGVYRLITASRARDIRLRMKSRLTDLRDSASRLILFITDIWSLAPSLCAALLLAHVWAGIEAALRVNLTTKLLRSIESGIVSSDPSASAVDVSWALGLSVACAAITGYLSKIGGRLDNDLTTLILSHFELYLMKVKLCIDVPASLDASSKISVSARDAVNAFREIVRFCTAALRVSSQIVVIYRESTASGDPIFLLACLAQPVLTNLTRGLSSGREVFAYVNNQDYKRMKSLKKMASDEHREDVLTNDLSSWILSEYQTASDNLGDTSRAYPLSQYYYARSPIGIILRKVVGHLPMVYCAFKLIRDPSYFSVASIAIYQTSTSNLQRALNSIFAYNGRFWKSVHKVKELYSVADLRSKIVGGDLPYPSSESSERGMSFELRDLSFTYPGSHKTSGALENISLQIPSGSLVIIVGTNGSGKSTLVRLLARLFDPTSGELLIDGRPARDYNLANLRQASTILSQESKVYPLSFAENIGVGHVESSSDMRVVEKAAAQGGAAEFIAKLENGYDSKLKDANGTMVINIYGKTNHPAHKDMDKLKKKMSISGGEKQRLVASRAFMSFNSGKVRFVAVDEPSSALDANGELHLFNQLLEAREGKTMIFVTHRFGHLTKHADLIICMKNGKIVERGKHEELLNRGGEYSKLFSIQADAFGKA